MTIKAYIIKKNCKTTYAVTLSQCFIFVKLNKKYYICDAILVIKNGVFELEYSNKWSI
jgi:hypothetical protein